MSIYGPVGQHATDNQAPRIKLPDGRIVQAEPGYCLWCGEYVAIGRKEAGATRPLDPAWHDGGDFGCEKSPDTCDEGTGDHARPWDLLLRLMSETAASASMTAARNAAKS